MAVKVNKEIKGTKNNDTLTNANTSGFTDMTGYAGNDTYIINNLYKTATSVMDTSGNDTVQINNINGNDIMFLFDVSIDQSSGDNPFDELYISSKANATSAMNQLINFFNDGINFNYNAIPQTNLIEIADYFGTTNNGGSQYGKGEIETIKAVNANGVKYIYNIKKLVSDLTPQIVSFLSTNGFNSVHQVMISGTNEQKTALLNIFKNAPIDCTINGTEADNTINGSSGNDVINGLAGNDTIYGNAGNDTLNGGNGNDSLFGGAGDDLLYGNAGNDTIRAGVGNDQIWGGIGNDSIYFVGGNNTAVFANGNGADIVYSGTGNDTLKFTGYANIAALTPGITVAKSANNLVLKYNSGNDSVTISDYFVNNTSSVKTLMANNAVTVNLTTFLNNKTINISGTTDSANNITGTIYKDIIYGANKADTLRGGENNDILYGYAGYDTLYGGNGNDTLEGGEGNDTLYGEAGNDTLNGGNGNDSLFGGEGNDLLYGNAGNDTIRAGAGDDQIWGGVGNDSIYFVGGNNTAVFANGNGADIIYSGTGNDTLKFTGYTNIAALNSGINVAKSANNLVLKYNSGNDSITISDYFVNNTSSVKTLMANNAVTVDLTTFLNNKTINITGIADTANNITGTIYNDIITGNNKNDVLNGGSGNDTLYGALGNDTLYGESGNDTLSGGKGNDIIYTGTGTNTVIINKGDGNDTIYHQGDKTTVKINSANASDSMSFAKNGNNLVLTYTHVKAANETANVKEVVTFINYFNNDGTVKSDEVYLQTTSNQKVSAWINQRGLNLSGSTNITGTDFSDIITGSDSADVIQGGLGYDTIYGKGGNDTINGGNGNDTIYGGAGRDTISGGIGNDKIYGGTGNDTINGGAGTNTLYFASGDGNDTVQDGSGTDTLVFTSETRINNVTAEYDGNDVILSYTGGTVRLKDYSTTHSAKYIQVGSTTKSIADILPTPPLTPHERANMVVGTDGADTLVQKYSSDTNIYNVYENQQEILKSEYGATQAWIDKYTTNLERQSREVSDRWYHVRDVLQKIKQYEYYIANYDNPNFTGDTYFKRWTKEYYQDCLAQANSAAYGLTYTWETYRDSQLEGLTENTAEYEEALDNLKYSIEYARYKNTADNLTKYQGYAADITSVQTFRDIAIAHGYTEDNGYEYWEDKANQVLRTLNGFTGSKQAYESLLEAYANADGHEDFKTLLNNYKLNNEMYQEDFDNALAQILENNSDIKAAYDTYEEDLATFNLYNEYSRNYYNAEYLGEGYIDTIEDTNYVSFRQEAEEESTHTVIHDYGQGKYRYRTGQEYWAYRANLVNREINGYEGSEANYDYFYMLSRNADPRSIYYDLWREARDEYNDYIDEYNKYAQYVNNWEDETYTGESNDDANRTADYWIGEVSTTNRSLNGVIYVYNTEVDKLNNLIQEIKATAPTAKDKEVALQILTHLHFVNSGSIILAGDGADDITIGHINPNDIENASYYNVLAMGQGGNDTYRIETYKRPSSYYSDSVAIEILDHEGANTIRLVPDELKSGNIGIYANVTLVKNPDGTYATNSDGSYQYTLENFNSSMTDSGNINSMIQRTPYKNGDSGCALIIVDAKTYSDKSLFYYGVTNDRTGIRLDIETVNHLNKIYAADGKYITQAQLNAMFQNTANMLAQRGYGSFMEALCLDGVYDDYEHRQYNLSALTSSEALGSLEWINPAAGVIEGATTGTEGTNTNDKLTSTSANETFNLKLGNDTVTFTGNFGNDIIQSSSTVDNNSNARQADTLNLSEYSVSDGTLKFSMDGDNLVMTAYDSETIKGTVTYQGFLGRDYISRTFILNAQDHTYMVSYNEAQLTNLHGTTDTGLVVDDQSNDNYNIRFIRSESEGNVVIYANANRAHYYALDDTPINLTTQNGEVKEIFSLGNANDRYNERIGEDTNLIIHDAGGNDVLYTTGTWSTTLGDANMRFFFDLNADGTVSDAKHIIYTNNFYVPEKNEEGYTTGNYHYATDELIKLLNNDKEHMKGVITIYGDIEEIENDNHPSYAYPEPIHYNEFIRSISIDVVQWLKDNHFESVTNALTQLKADIDEKQEEIAGIDLSGIERDEYGNIDQNTIPIAYTTLKNEIDELQGKLDELLGFYNTTYADELIRNMFGTDGDDDLNASWYNGSTKYIEAGKGNDIINSSGYNEKIVYDYIRGDGHDTLLNMYTGNSIYIRIGDLTAEQFSARTKFRTDGWDLKMEIYKDSTTTDLKGSITIKDYFKTNLDNRVDKLVFVDSEENETEKSIDTILRTDGVLNNENVLFGTGNSNENYVTTNANDIIYTNGGWNGTIPSSAGNDSIYVTKNTLIKYTLGQGDDTIYRGDSNYFDNNTLYFDYGTTDVSVEFRRLPNEGDVPDDLKVLFFNESAQKVGSLTIKGYFYNFLLENEDRQLHKLTIRQNGIETTGLSLTDMLTNYINSGASLVPNNDIPYYNIIRINGSIELNNSGKVDRLIFEDVDSFADLHSNLVNGNLVITYDDKTVVINGYQSGTSSVYDVRVNGEYKTLGDLSGLYYGTNGDDIFIHNTEENVVHTYNLNKGNDIVEFPATPSSLDYENGDKIYNKAVINSVADTTSTTDTIKLHDYQIKEIIFGYTNDGSGITLKAEKEYTPSTLVSYNKYTDITYSNFITGNTPTLSVETDYDNFIIHKHNGVQNIEYDRYNDANIYVDYIQANSGTSKVQLKDNMRVLTNGGANLIVTAWGGNYDYNMVTTYSTTSNDTYCIYNSDSSNLRIFDNGGNDTIRLYNSYTGNEYEWLDATSDCLRLLFNVNKDGSTDNSFVLTNHTYNSSSHIINDARSFMSSHNMWGYNNGTIFVEANPTGNKKVGIEKLILCSTEYVENQYGEGYYNNTPFGQINLESWYNAVRTDVQAWLNSNGRTYASTADVFELGYQDSSNEEFISLMNVYDRSATAYLSDYNQ